MNRFDRAFWQLRELETLLSRIQPQLSSINELSQSVAKEYAQLANLRERFTLPSDYLDLNTRLQEVLDSTCTLKSLELLSSSDANAVRLAFRSHEAFTESLQRLQVEAAKLNSIGKRVSESFLPAETLLGLGRITESMTSLALQPQLAFYDFAQKHTETASRLAQVAKQNHLLMVDTAANFLNPMSAGFEVAVLMSGGTFKSAPSVPPPSNVFVEIDRQVEQEDFSDSGVDVERRVSESPVASIVENGARLVQLLYNLNVEAERESRPVIFKPTNKGLLACSLLSSRVATDESTFGDVVDQLYFLLYEGSGEAKRLIEHVSEGRLQPLWALKQLRLGFRHDVDHGKRSDMEKKNQKIGDAYRMLLGSVAPRSRADWAKAQLALYELLVSMFEEVWAGPPPDEAREE